MSSPDGVNWTGGSWSGATRWISGVTYGNGTFVAVGDRTVVTSADGFSWTVRSSDTITRLSGIAHGAGTFVAVGNQGLIVTSPDGMKWTKPSWAAVNGLSGIAYGNGIFVAAGYDSKATIGVIVTSPNGANWTQRSPGAINWLSGLMFGSVGYGNGTFIILWDGYQPHRHQADRASPLPLDM